MELLECKLDDVCDHCFSLVRKVKCLEGVNVLMDLMLKKIQINLKVRLKKLVNDSFFLSIETVPKVV